MPSDGKGRTLWEMLLQRIHHPANNGSGIPFYNPLGAQVNAAFPVPYANGADLADHSFTVREIHEYNRIIGGQDYVFVDYLLHGINQKTLDSADNLEIRVRAVPNTAGTHDDLILRIEDEFGFAEEFLAIVNDPGGVFEVTDDTNGARETFQRCNNLRDSYVAAVMVVAATTPEGRAANAQTSPAKIEYWDYWRELDLGGGHTAPEYLFVELNRETGWFQIWRGREFYQ